MKSTASKPGLKEAFQFNNERHNTYTILEIGILQGQLPSPRRENVSNFIM
jgi:hypothetical protein